MSISGPETQRDWATRLASRHWRGLAGFSAVLYLAGLAGLLRLTGFSWPVLAGWLAGAATTAGLLYLLRQLARPARAAAGRHPVRR
jgi:hypothetical protein